MGTQLKKVDTAKEISGVACHFLTYDCIEQPKKRHKSLSL
jgi:hypothetical protein